MAQDGGAARWDRESHHRRHRHRTHAGARATQENLRLVIDGASGVETVRHDHSVARALNRGADFGEGDQMAFIEDHGFMIRTDAISTVIDPRASFTLEYVDHHDAATNVNMTPPP